MLPISTFCIPGHFCKDNRQHSDNTEAHNAPPLHPRWIMSNLSERWAICSASIMALTNTAHPNGATIQHLPAVLHKQFRSVLMIPSRAQKGQAQLAPTMPPITPCQEALGRSHNKQKPLHSTGTYLLHLHHSHLHFSSASCCSPSWRCLQRDKKTTIVPCLAQLQGTGIKSELLATTQHVANIIS